MALSKITSVKLAPALPIISAITAPSPIPFAANAALNGITVSARMYSGIPISTAAGIANQLSSLAIVLMSKPRQYDALQ